MGARIPPSGELIERARERAGLHDLGSDTFREGLEVLVESMNTEADLSEAGAVRVIDMLTRSLVNRLEIESWYEAHPELASEVVEGPVLVTGLPRTGTTAMVALLALDDQVRYLRRWEQERCCPPPVAGAEHDDPRAVAAREVLRSRLSSNPELRAMHLYDSDGPEECYELMNLELRSQFYMAHHRIPGYVRWWLECDMAPAFAYHHRALRLLQSRRGPRRWLLKAPHHLFCLDAFVAEYPGTRIVMTHRDPARAIPSGCSLMGVFRAKQSDSWDPAAFGPGWLEFWAEGMDRALRARQLLGEDRFFDVDHGDLNADPVGTVEAIYRWLGRELSPQTRARVAAYAERNRSGAHGSHSYSAEEFGLTREAMWEAFDGYLSRFPVAARS